MAEALIRVIDIDGAVDIQVKFSPEVDDNSPAHKMVVEFVKFAKLEPAEVENNAG